MKRAATPVQELSLPSAEELERWLEELYVRVPDRAPRDPSARSSWRPAPKTPPDYWTKY
jgi:hypothetical protein